MHTMKHILLTLLLALAATTGARAENLRYATLNMRYDEPADSLNNWQYRRERIAQFITSRRLDILGTQELLAHQADWLRRRLPGYEMAGVARDDGRRRGEYAAIFYRHDRFEALDGGTFWLAEHPDSVGMRGWDAACTRIATWIKLRERATGRTIVAVNTHFDHVGTVARRQSALLIIDKVGRIAGTNPMVLTGDFNVDDTSEAYRTITTNRFRLIDAHKAADQRTGCDYTWHDFGRLPAERRTIIDFVFTTPDLRVLRADIPEFAPGAFLSDHNPLVVELAL